MEWEESIIHIRWDPLDLFAGFLSVLPGVKRTPKASESQLQFLFFLWGRDGRPNDSFPDRNDSSSQMTVAFREVWKYYSDDYDTEETGYDVMMSFVLWLCFLTLPLSDFYSVESSDIMRWKHGYSWSMHTTSCQTEIQNNLSCDSPSTTHFDWLAVSSEVETIRRLLVSCLSWPPFVVFKVLHFLWEKNDPSIYSFYDQEG